MVTLAAFGAVDWGVLLVYLAGMVAIGWAVSRKQDDADDFFLGGRRVPAWAAALSFAATATSAATFIGAPQHAFVGDLRYLIWNLSGILAAIVVAFWLIPAFYREGGVTVYGYLAKRIDGKTARSAAIAFLIGRLMASGARLFMAGIAFSLILFGRTDATAVALSIIVLSVVGTAYTVMGGIRAVIWTDVVQLIVVVGAAIVSIAILARLIDLPMGEAVHLLRSFPQDDGTTIDKLHWADWTMSFEKPTVPAAFVFTLFFVAAYGCDHDMAQRLLTTRSASRASASLISAILVGVVLTLLFMTIGLMLAVYYHQSPDLSVTATGSKDIYPRFLIDHLPAGLSGLAMAGLLAAALSTYDSAVNAMAAAWVADVRGNTSRHATRWTVVVMGALLMIFGLLMQAMYDPEKTSLLDFALNVMAYAYTGLLGVFLTALLVPGRGHWVSATAALICGIIFVECARWVPLSLPWTMLLGTVLCFFICAVGKVGYHRDPEVSES